MRIFGKTLHKQNSLQQTENSAMSAPAAKGISGASRASSYVVGLVPHIRNTEGKLGVRTIGAQHWIYIVLHAGCLSKLNGER